MVLIMFSSDCVFVFDLCSFFRLPYSVCLGVFILRRLITLSLKPPTLFLFLQTYPYHL